MPQETTTVFYVVGSKSETVKVERYYATERFYRVGKGEPERYVIHRFLSNNAVAAKMVTYCIVKKSDLFVILKKVGHSSSDSVLICPARCRVYGESSEKSQPIINVLVSKD